jgi:glutathione peroxidase
LKNKAAMVAIKAVSKTCKKDGDIVWNFTKFLVDREGNVVKRFDPTFKPDDMEDEIVSLLK